MQRLCMVRQQAIFSWPLACMPDWHIATTPSVGNNSANAKPKLVARV